MSDNRVDNEEKVYPYIGGYRWFRSDTNGSNRLNPQNLLDYNIWRTFAVLTPPLEPSAPPPPVAEVVVQPSRGQQSTQQTVGQKSIDCIKSIRQLN